MTRKQGLTMLREYIHKHNMALLMESQNNPDLDPMDAIIIRKISDRYKEEKAKLKEEILRAMGIG